MMTMKKALVAFALLCILCCSVDAGAVKGVKPENLSRYQPHDGNFACLDGSAFLQFSSVNDDFCDCKDGSDEPGTSACANGEFYCANKLHIPEVLRSSRVNDGVCDCCDGSDEYSGLIICKNTCEEAGRAARQEAERLHRIQQEGYASKQQLIETALKTKQDKHARRKHVVEELEKVKELVQELEQLKEQAEHPEVEAKKEFDKSWQETVKAQEERAKRWLFSILDVNKDEVLTPEELKQHVTFGEGEDAITEEDVMSAFETAEGETASGEKGLRFEQFAGDVYDKIKHLFEHHEDFVKPYGEVDKPAYDEAIEQLIEVAEEARKAYQEADTKRFQLNKDLEVLEKHLGMDFGPEHEFLPLLDQCWEIEDREYRYKLCMFDKVTQEPKNGGRSTSLGTWRGWAAGEGGHTDYHHAEFTDGEKCWNGPNRSTKVEFVCGPATRIVEVSEPNRCEYAMRVECAAVCTAPPLPHDEL
eukprot:m.9769 g.9769  ORF g.9769 m.9769 type:complete len:474 (+) comp5818_c0_seq1:86-1507(+)